MEKETMKELTEKHGTPLYVYDEDAIRAKFRKLKTFPYKNTDIYFASMSNSNPEIIKIVKEEKLKLFVNSRKHLSVGYSAGFDSSQISFTASNLSKDDLLMLYKDKVFTNLDSLGQLEQVGKLMPGVEVGLRINLDLGYTPTSHAGVFIGPDSRIGIQEDKLPMVENLLEKYNLRLISLHVYLGTNIFDIDVFVKGVDRLIEIAEKFTDVRIINIGGGLGVPEHENDTPFDYDSYSTKVSETVDRGSKRIGRELKLILEPGRYLLASEGVFLTKVVDIKETSKCRFIGTDASVAIFPRPLFYPDTYHPLSHLDDNGEMNLSIPTFITGKSTYSRDFLARDIRLPEIKPNDTLCFKNAGAYCYSSITDFLGFDRPAEILLTKNGPKIIREAS